MKSIKKESLYSVFPRLDIVKRILEDKRAIEACYDNGGNIESLARERNITFAQPI